MFERHFQSVFVKVKDPFSSILGAERAKRHLCSALAMARHVLVLGPPGVGKTTLAKNVAGLLPDEVLNDCPYHCDPDVPLCPECRLGKHKSRSVKGSERFVRVQGSPDLTAEDLLGDIDPVKALKFGPMSIEAFTPGKIFRANRGVLFFDELNRCPEKVQNALLQVLEEGRATIGAYTVDLPADFIFVGTMNPEETSATEKLSDVLLDRFDIVHMTYPESDSIEKEIVLKHGVKANVSFPPDLLHATVLFVRSLRGHKDVQKKPSVRATMGLYERAQSNSLLEGRKTVSMRDVSDAVISVLSHRIALRPSVKYLQTPEQFLAAELAKFVDEHPDLDGGGGL